jgi:hypothetical protein
MLGIVDELLGLLAGIVADGVGLRGGGPTDLVGVDVGLRDDSGRLLLGNAKQALELRAQSDVCGLPGLLQQFLRFVECSLRRGCSL